MFEKAVHICTNAVRGFFWCEKVTISSDAPKMAKLCFPRQVITDYLHRTIVIKNLIDGRPKKACYLGLRRCWSTETIVTF